MLRKCELVLVVGINGTGKTSFIRNEIVSKQKSLIVTPDPAEWKELQTITTANEIRNLQGAARIVYDSTETLELIKENYSGGALILDDAMAYLNEQTPNILQYLYIRRRQFGIDLYIVGHGLRQLPPKCFTFGSWLILFNSVENFQARKNELIPDIYNKVIEAQERISKKVSAGEPYYKEIILLDQQIRGTYVAQTK
ncbi:MAG: hypothetical protein RBT49_11865 [Bacteroidales bacterium]|jgi:hypothetical protein|nr:hypothetical protein [Bacteroidales bacterium]